MTTTHDQLLKQQFRPMLIGNAICFGRRVGDRSLRVHLHGETATVELWTRTNGGVVTQVTQVSAITVGDSLTACIDRVVSVSQSGGFLNESDRSS
jgi:hypothetical protein